MIILVFIWGALMGPLAIFLQFLALKLCQPTIQWSQFSSSLDQNSYFFFLNIIIFAPLTEEFLKYLVVKWQVLKNPDFDEPLDAMIYLIISALGFAAVENILNIFLMPDITLRLALSQSLARFLSATLLHSLCSGILGYFLARSLLNLRKRHLIFGTGFLLAVAVHSFYNYLAWLLDFNKFFTFAMALFLLAMVGLVGWQFRYLKNQLAICKIR
jgi:RsiW-degrading membrane proteinase PrsW (M82 family)